jgi:hypothetical protein
VGCSARRIASAHLLDDGFGVLALTTSKTAQGRFEPAGPRRTGRSRSTVVRWPHGGQLSNALLTLMAALAAELDVGLMAFTRHTPSGGGRLLTLRCCPSCMGRHK